MCKTESSTDGEGKHKDGKKADFLVQSDDDDDVALKNKNNRSSAQLSSLSLPALP